VTRIHRAEESAGTQGAGTGSEDGTAAESEGAAGESAAGRADEPAKRAEEAAVNNPALTAHSGAGVEEIVAGYGGVPVTRRTFDLGYAGTINAVSGATARQDTMLRLTIPDSSCPRQGASWSAASI